MKRILLGIVGLFGFSGCFLNGTANFEPREIAYPTGFNIVEREDWGWQPLTESMPTHAISKIMIHHGGEDFAEDKDPVLYLRNLQNWSRNEKKWIDIPYHYMIDLQGRVYEARPLAFPGDTNTTYNPRGHVLICVMGNYENQTISEDQLNSVIELTALLAREFEVDIDDAIKGHKDYAETLCPGKDLYKYLRNGEVQRRVRQILAN